MDLAQQYMASARKEFVKHKALAEKAMEQLQPQQLFTQPSNESNSIAIIVQHLHGNMLSRWTDFLTSDGEKPWRRRDEEFEANTSNREELMQKWEEGWACFFKALDSLQPQHLAAEVTIRNERMTAMDAITRQVAHYSYHVGQIVYLAKLLKTGEWNTLSIAKRKK